MKTEILTVDPRAFSPDCLQNAAGIIRRGGLVAFPTETVYGLGASALNGAACDAIFEAKGRPHDNPLIVHVADPAEFSLYTVCPDKGLFSELAARFMPGPLTVIMPKKSVIPDEVTVGLDTVAIRCPSHPVAHALIERSGVPIAAPSANRSGKPSPTKASHVIEDLSGRVDLIIDGGDSDVGVESTVILLAENRIRLLRPGFVTLEDLKSVTPNVDVDPAVLAKLREGAAAPSPGMKYRHYAPKAAVTLLHGCDENVRAVFREELQKGAGILCFEEDLPFLSDLGQNELVVSFGKRDDLRSQAHRLFDALRAFDRLPVDRVFARETTQNEIGLAVTNRLLRACAFDVRSV